MIAAVLSTVPLIVINSFLLLVPADLSTLRFLKEFLFSAGLPDLNDKCLAINI